MSTPSIKNRSLNLYRGEPQHDVFSSMASVFPTNELSPSSSPFQFAEGTKISLPTHYQFEEEQKSSAAFIENTDTSALLVLKNGKVAFEQYWLTGGRDVNWISWSVAKSFIATLVGIAIEEGLIESIEVPITRYVRSLEDSAYDGVSIKHVLQMSSGARWSEDYSDDDSDIFKLAAVMSGDSSLEQFVASIKNETKPGTICQYNSADTQALGLLLVAVTGQSITSYMQNKICEPLGMESGGQWLVDKTGMEMALGGLNLTARDFAKIGELYRQKGNWSGKKIVSEDWVKASVKPDAEHLEAGKVVVGGHILPLGYGYQWWVPAGDDGEFSAIGVYNQFIYVDPSRDVTIVKLSANRTYGTTNNESENQEMENIEFLRAIARSMD